VSLPLRVLPRSGGVDPGGSRVPELWCYFNDQLTGRLAERSALVCTNLCTRLKAMTGTIYIEQNR